jgi:tRNA(Ile2) C34 agmatinyltransferase TiaS
MKLFISRVYKAYCGICGKETKHEGLRCTKCGR